MHSYNLGGSHRVIACVLVDLSLTSQQAYMDEFAQKIGIKDDVGGGFQASR